MITEIDISDIKELTLLKSEFQDLQKSRFSVRFDKNKIIIKAKDEHASKTILHSITQAREVYKKISLIK
jgi:HSP20 family molecular chaperone IbpA